MPEIKEITSHVVEDELHICPDCGYERGFHTSFISVQATRDTPVRSTRDMYRVILICPECGARYDIGWRIALAEFETRVVKTTARSATCVPHGNPADCLPALPPHDRPPE